MKEYKKIVNQLNRTRKIPSLEFTDKLKLERMKEKYYNKIKNDKKE